MSKVDFDELVRDALKLEADNAAIVQVEQIKFVEDFRRACEQNICRKYDTNWMCPPAVGSFAELKERALKYGQGLLFQTIHQLTGPFDWNGMMDAAKSHEETFKKILENARAKHNLKDVLPLKAGDCTVCPKCAYLDNEKCRFPDKAFASVEAYGIDVINLEKSCGIPYYNGKGTVSYVGLILFNFNLPA